MSKKEKVVVNKYKQRAVVAVLDEPKRSAKKPPFEVGDELVFGKSFKPLFYSIDEPCVAVAITENGRFVSGWSVTVNTTPDGPKELDSWHFSKRLP